jgi:citronellol/citronellal dehydrogenase
MTDSTENISTLKLKDKVAIVTGASRGIGKAIALEFARQGACVTLAARTRTEINAIIGSLEKTADAICSLGGRVLSVKTDISKQTSVEAMVRKTLEQWKRIDILVNNAATNFPAGFAEMPLRNWDRIIDVNLRGMVFCTKGVLQKMIEQRYGHIINISSVVTQKLQHEPFTGIAYDMTKVAMNRFTLGLAEELKEHNIAVNALMPDNTETEGWAYLNPDADRKSWDQPEEWARYAVYVASQEPAKFTGKLLLKDNIKEYLKCDR